MSDDASFLQKSQIELGFSWDGIIGRFSLIFQVSRRRLMDKTYAS